MPALWNPPRGFRLTAEIPPQYDSSYLRGRRGKHLTPVKQKIEDI